MFASCRVRLTQIAIVLLLSVSQGYCWMLHPSCTDDPALGGIMQQAVQDAISMAANAAGKLSSPPDNNYKDLGVYLFGADANIQLAATFLGRVGSSFGTQEPYTPDRSWSNVLIFCNVDHWKANYVEKTIDNKREKILDKDNWGEPDHGITILKSDLAQCSGTFANNAAFTVSLNAPGKSYIQFCPWYLQSIKATPYPGSWVVKNWKVFLNGARSSVQRMLGKKTPMDLAAGIDHLMLHELTHTKTVISQCSYPADQCPADSMPHEYQVGGGSRDIPFGWVLSDLKAYFWPNCVAKAGNQGWDNGAYNADNLAYAALGVRQIDNGNRVERSGKLTALQTAKARIRRFLGLD